MLIICTSSSERALDDLNLLSSFDTTLRIPSLTSPEDVEKVLITLAEGGDSTFTDYQRSEIVSILRAKPFKVGIKRLIRLATKIARRDEPKERVECFISRLEDGGYIKNIK